MKERQQVTAFYRDQFTLGSPVQMRHEHIPLPLKAEIGEALMISVVSLIVRPALAWLLAAQIFGLPDAFVRAAVVMAVMPPGVNDYVFAAMYGRAVGTAASAVILGTILSLATITIWLALLGGAGI
jgi:malonate transporter